MNLAPTASAYARSAAGAAPAAPRIPLVANRATSTPADATGSANPSVAHAILAYLFGGSTPMDDERARAAAVTQARDRQAAERDLQQFTSGAPIPQRPQAFDPAANPGPAPEAPSLTMDGMKTPLKMPSNVPMLNVPQVTLPERSPMADAMGKPVNMRNALPFLMRVDPARAKEAAAMIEAAQPKPKQLAQTDGFIGAFDPEVGTLSELHKGAPKHEWKEVTLPNEKGTKWIDLNDPAYDGPQSPAGAASPQASGLTPGFDAVYHGFVAPHEGGYTPSDGNGAPASFGINQKANPEVDVKNLTADGAKSILHDKYWVPSGAEHLPPALQAVQFDTAVNMGVGAANSLLAQSGGDPNKYLALREQRYRAIAAADPSKASRLPTWLARNDDLAHYVSGQAETAPTSPDGPRSIPGSAPKPPEWQSDGKGFLHNRNGDVKADPTFEVGEADPNMVKMVLEGRYPPPTGRAATDPKWQSVLMAASAQDPNFNAADYHTRYATRKDFTSGKAAQNITALNTAIGHIGELDKQIDGLGNTSIPMLNTAKNWIETATGDPRIGNFNTTKSAVASELVRVFRQSGGTEADIQDFQKPLAAANSPEQLKGVVREMTKLLASRLDAMASQYKQGLGQDKSGIEFLNPKAQATFSRIMGSPMPDAGGQQRLSPVDAAKLPPGAQFVGLDGVARVRH